jgi:hypothetical protein
MLLQFEVDCYVTKTEHKEKRCGSYNNASDR